MLELAIIFYFSQFWKIYGVEQGSRVTSVYLPLHAMFAGLKDFDAFLGWMVHRLQVMTRSKCFV
jgi:hypothetical protein